MVEDCKSLRKSCVLLVSGSEKRLVHFLKENFVVLESEPIILDHNMLYLKLLIDLFFPSLVQLSEFADFQDILLNFRVKLLLKDSK